MLSLRLGTVAIFASALGAVNAQSPAPSYGQCGGQGWSGATTCVSGYSCTTSNPYYSQCLPGTAATTTSAGSSTTTSSGAAASGSQIRTVSPPVYHFYVQSNGGKAQLGPEASSGYFSISGSISLNDDSGSALYLNLNDTASTSYKPLTFGTTATTIDWGLEGDTIITTSPRQLNFIACATSDPNFYDIYLQTGNDTPSGGSCTLQTMHLPCLC